MYRVYLYTWSNGAFYIGRTQDNQKRYNNPSKYKTQFVGKYMSLPHADYIIYESTNAVEIFWLEATLINIFYDNPNCLNVACEEPILAAGKAASEYEHIKDFSRDLSKFNDWSILSFIYEKLIEDLINEDTTELQKWDIQPRLS